jgi:hypothetical protein
MKEEGNVNFLLHGGFMQSKNAQIFCFLVLMIPVFLAACGKKNIGTSEAASLAMKGISGNPVNMNGKWKGCSHSGADQQDTLDTQTLDGGSMNITSTIWTASLTANCLQTSDPEVFIAGTATVTLGAEATATWTAESGSTLPPAGITANATATKATLVFNSLTLTPGTDAFANFFNARAECGKTNWVKDVAMDVLNCTGVLPSTTRTDYWVVDDSAATLKLYTQLTTTADYQVDSVGPLLK